MTDAATPAAPQVRAEVVVIAVIVALALAAVGYVLSQRQQELRASPLGLSGLQVWLAAGGGEAQVFSGGWMVDPDSVGLLVLPLHDTAPGSDLQPPETTEELIFQQDESDLEWDTVFAKIDRVPTLVVLPKWRSGMRLTGIAHPALLVEEARLDAMLRHLTGLPQVRIARAPRAFTALPYAAQDGTAMRAELYAAQLFDGTGCDPVIGSGPQTLLAWCPVGAGESEVLILSDPDLLNNHGLRLGQNAAIVRDALSTAARAGSVLIDYSRDNWFAPDDAPIRRERTWADLARFFEPPFLVLWLGAGAMLALVLWRSLRRAGPVAAAAEPGGGKLQTIRARARLMRLTGQDGTMIGDYAAARIAATAARLVGPGHARQIGEERAFLRYVARRRPALAERLDVVLTRIHALPPRVPAATVIGHADDLERILELIAHDT